MNFLSQTKYHPMFQTYNNVISSITKMFRKHFAEPETYNWEEWFRRLPKSAFILWLASHVADELFAYKNKNISLDDLIDSVNDRSSGETQHSAERFIEIKFGYFLDHDKSQKVIWIFRRAVKRKLRRLAYINK